MTCVLGVHLTQRQRCRRFQALRRPVSYEASEATVVWRATPDDPKVIAALKELGYRAGRVEARSAETQLQGLLPRTW